MKNATRKQILVDPVVLEAALQGLELRKQKLDKQIASVRAMLGKRGPGRPKLVTISPAAGGKTVTVIPAPRKRRKLSPDARKRIAMANKRRWAEYHENKKTQDEAVAV